MDDTTRESALGAGWLAGLGYTLQRPRQTPAGMLGEQLGSGVGNSVEFMDYREYTPGDDLRRLDWGVFGRTDRLVVKLHREEVSPHCDVVVDASGSMRLEGTAKGAATWGLAAALAAACDNARMTRRVFTARERLEPVAGGEGDVAGWASGDLLEESAAARGGSPGGGGSLGRALHHVTVPLRRRGVRVLVSDLLIPDDPWSVVSRLGEGAGGAAAVFVVQVLARQDADPRWTGDLRLIDSETGALREVRLDAAALRRYHERLDRLREQWRGACRRVGGRLIELIAEDVVAGWDLRPLAEAGLLRAG